MQKIIYSSTNKIDWDAQSAFKITNYYTDNEECMVFCYLKQYLQNGDLKICTFCFDKEAAGKQDLQLCFNLNPLETDAFIHVEFGFDGINHIKLVNLETEEIAEIAEDSINFRSFRTNDQQGFYWCGEITIPQQLTKDYFNTVLAEKSIIQLNFYKIFADKPDYACLFPDESNQLLSKGNAMQEFVILDY